MNEDVFVAPSSAAEVKTVDSDIQEVTEQIHRLLLQVSRRDQRGAARSAGVTREFERFLSSVISQFTPAGPAATAASPEPTTFSA